MIDIITKNAQEYMERGIQTFKNQISKVHVSGRASSNLLDNVMVKCYSGTMPLRKLANITVKDSHTLTISVFDHTLIPAVKKSIMISNLGLNPFLTGTIILVPLPPLTEEKRKHLIKVVRNDAERWRISIRNIRRNANDSIKSLLKNKKINKDNDRYAQDEIQKLANNFIKIIDELLEQKEKELMKF